MFDALKQSVYAALLKERAPHDTIRIWVPGCSTGEEAYSLAMTLMEFWKGMPRAIVPPKEEKGEK